MFGSDELQQPLTFKVWFAIFCCLLLLVVLLCCLLLLLVDIVAATGQFCLISMYVCDTSLNTILFPFFFSFPISSPLSSFPPPPLSSLSSSFPLLFPLSPPPYFPSPSTSSLSPPSLSPSMHLSSTGHLSFN